MATTSAQMKGTADKKRAALEGIRTLIPLGSRCRISTTGSITNSAEQPVAESSSATRRTSSAEQPAGMWRIWPSSEQVEVPKHKRTHSRPLPLPSTIDALIEGSTRRGVYIGHGLSKIVYRLTNGLVLKLCEKQKIRNRASSKIWRQWASTQSYTHRTTAS